MKRSRIILAILFGAIMSALIVSKWNADRFIPSIASALEHGLERKVEIRGGVHFLPWRLGFSLTDVVIHDDPRFGLEPLAYVEELQATIRWTALVRGSFEFDRLLLIDPSVNLAQNANGWNFPALLDQALGTSDGVAPPQVEVTGGKARLNVRFGETKSLYYLWDANLTLEPAAKDKLSIYFDGVPARTDRGQKGFGRLSARGTIGLSGKREVNLQVDLERSAASELLLLFQDRGSSVTGFFSGRAKLHGPLDALQIDGRVQLHEFERWAWLIGPGGGPGVEWDGLLNWGAQTLELKTKPDTLPVSIAVRGDHLLGPAEWHTQVAVHQAPAQALDHLAQEFGFALPGGTELAGELNGDVSYATKAGLDGRIDLTGGTLLLGGKEKAELEPAAVHFIGRQAKLDPVAIRQGTDLLRLEGGYQWADESGQVAPGLSWSFSGPELDLARAGEWGMALPGRIQSGKWHGSLRYEAATGGWRGEGDLLDSDIDVEGLAAKVHLDSARVRLQGAQFALSRMAGHFDTVEFKGDFQYDPAALVQSQLQLQLGEVPLAALAGLSPALTRQTNVLSRTLGLATPQTPDWVEGRRLSATVQAKSILLGEMPVGPVSVRVGWTNGRVKITSLSGPARLRGEGELMLLPRDADSPSHVTVENFPYRGGSADLTGDFDILRGQGKFQATARGVSLIEGERWMNAQAAGEFEGGASPRIRFSTIEIHPRAADEAGTLRGTGASRNDGTWEFDLQTTGPSGNRNVKIAGPVFNGVWMPVP